MSSNSRPDNTSHDLTASGSGSGSSSHLPTARTKLTALSRLKSFSGSFVGQRKAPPTIVFPPPSWELNDELLGKTTHTTNPPALLESNFERLVAEAPEAVPFARKLRALIESLPISLPLLSSSSTQSTTPEPQEQQDEGKQGSPIPPGMDDGLVRMLASENVMNGDTSTSGNGLEKERSSIWNILASLRKSDGKADTPRPSAVEEEEDGLMMYAPLEPKNDSQLKLADSETILEYVDEPTPSDAVGKSTATPKKTSIEKHIWVPSTTELSILTTWWGYRLYLPPPVMAKLDGTSMKAVARAAMLTAALKWMLDKIPIMLVPVQFRPAVKMLKQLGPLVGYIGVFIAWSWDRVRACDKGNGVVLTATWLLPVALLPMAWDAGDIYGPRPPLTSEEMSAAARSRTPGSDDESKSGIDKGKKPEKEKQKQKQKSKSLFSW